MHSTIKAQGDAAALELSLSLWETGFVVVSVVATGETIYIIGHAFGLWK